MSFVKREYSPRQTIITAENLNAIQDELIHLDQDKYDAPDGGIPATDLAQAVQQLLALAGSAYQKPDGGIPAADLAQAVQQLLTLAGSALQRGDIDTALSSSSENPVQNKAIYGKMTSTAQADAIFHLGFYLDENGDLCQVD